MEYSDAHKYHRLRKEEQTNKSRIIYNELGEGKTLDVGCGTGLSSQFFKNVVGIDPEPNLLTMYPGQCYQGKAEELPFKDKEFENVICVTCIHNFDDIEKGLKEMKRVGKHFGFSVIKASSKFQEIKEKIHSIFKVKKEIDEGIDTIFICD